MRSSWALKLECKNDGDGNADMMKDMYNDGFN
jgi:hypothetical protein